MAQLISNNYMNALLKTVYLSGVTNNKDQNSILLPLIGKEAFEGKEMKYAMQYSNGGNFGSNYAQLVNNATLGAKNGEWVMTPGYATGFFTIEQPEILTSDTDKAAYMKILANKMSACFDGLSKTMAVYLYGGKYATLEKVGTAITFGASTTAETTISVSSSTSIKLEPGSRIVFAVDASDATASLPSSPLKDGYATVKSIDDNSIVVTPSTDLVSETIPVGAYIQLYGCRGSNGTNGFDGLEDFIPTIGDRTGTAWGTYIATAFRGIDRSEAVNRLAGQFVKAANSGSHPLTDALMSLLKKTKRKGGGSNNQLILNDEDFDAIQKEADLVRSFFTNTDGNVKAKKNATFGLSDFSVAFGDATLGDTIVDPFCTYGKVYSLDKGDLKFYDIGNMGRVISPVSNGEIGKYDIESVGDQGIGNDPKVSLNTDKLFTVTPGTSGEFGPQFTIAANLFGNFKLEKTASSGVAVLR